MRYFNEIELQVAGEYLYILPNNATRPEVGWGIGDKEIGDSFSAISRAAGQEAVIREEYRGKKRSFDLRLPPDQLALSNVPHDFSLFPATVWFRQQMENRLIIYDPDPNVLRHPVPAGQPSMIRSNALNLPWLVLGLKRQSLESFKGWVEHVKLALPNLEFD